MKTKVRTWKQLQEHPAVSEAFSEYGNISNRNDYWVHLNEGWINTEMECGIIHEQTKTKCIEVFNASVKRI